MEENRSFVVGVIIVWAIILFVALTHHDDPSTPCVQETNDYTTTCN